jgi:predicted NAD/FAD-dependent oxidoreductase
MEPCWALLAAFDRPLDVGFDAARVDAGALAWLARESAKPGRRAAASGPAAQGELWVVHASPAWSRDHLEAAPERVRDAMLASFAAITGAVRAAPVHADVHRWRFARAVRPLGAPCVLDASRRVGLCGDWLHGNGVEAAYLSGLTLAGRLTPTLPSGRSARRAERDHTIGSARPVSDTIGGTRVALGTPSHESPSGARTQRSRWR